MLQPARWGFLVGAAVLTVGVSLADYTNFEASHVHPIDLVSNAEGTRLLAVNTPDAVLELFDVQPDGSLVHTRSIPVGLEPVTVIVRNASEAWVANYLSDTVSVVDLDLGRTVKTLHTGNEPSDVAFAAGRAFVAAGGEDAVEVFDLANLDAPPATVPIFSRRPRALAVSSDGTRVYAVTLFSGNQTTVVPAASIWGTGPGYRTSMLSSLGLTAPPQCFSEGPSPPYPDLPAGIVRNPNLPGGSAQPSGLSLIVRWTESVFGDDWLDEDGTAWTACLPFRLPDYDLFVIDAATLATDTVAHLGTSLFDVSVHPNGKVYVPNTDARNFVRFEHPLGLRGHFVDDRLSIVDPADANAVTRIDLNVHIDRGSDPGTNLAERNASISQPGMLVWNAAGSAGYITAIGSRKLFRVDGTCTAGNCIFGPTRAAPNAVEVGEGPTGVALYEGGDRLYVLNRFSNSIAVVRVSNLTKLDEVPLHDPSPASVLLGRRFLYDAIVGSGHGDAACSSCHISGDRDELAWDLGNPEEDFVPYTGQGDNLRFIVPLDNYPTPCEEVEAGNPLACAAETGFDPQKGPRTTMTLRGMFEPMHWRGDRATMNDFNRTFVDLLGTGDIGPINGHPAGLSAVEMEWLRQFALGIEFPPNPQRPVDGGLFALRGLDLPIPGTDGVTGRAYEGWTWFHLAQTAGPDGESCSACHKFGTGGAGGVTGGVTPESPTSALAAPLVDGHLRHDIGLGDFKVAQLRNTYEKIGPRYGSSAAPALARSGFGLGHDGSVPDLGTLLSSNHFPNLTNSDLRDVAAFVLVFMGGIKPAVGRNFTLAPGSLPTGSADDEQTLLQLVGDPDQQIPALGDMGDPNPDCELTASAPLGGRLRFFRYEGGLFRSDVGGEPPLSVTALREAAEGPISFLCAPRGSGLRLGGDRDEDAVLNGDDCAASDPGSWAEPSAISGLVASKAPAALLNWPDQANSVGPSRVYDVLGGEIDGLRALGRAAATTCVAADLTDPAFDDSRQGPTAGSGHYYLVRARNPCGSGDVGIGSPPACP